MRHEGIVHRQPTIADRFLDVRKATEELARPLSAEDCVVQSMPDASPVKWHLGHTTWFFETFVLQRVSPNRKPVDPQFGYLFNSYYNSVGDRQPRPKRGLMTRPSLDDVLSYRRLIDAELAGIAAKNLSADVLAILEIGLHHEQQHQELILTDVKHLLSCNPSRPAYIADAELNASLFRAAEEPSPPAPLPGGEGSSTFDRRSFPLSSSQAAVRVPRRNHLPADWISFAEGLVEIGHGGDGFSYDNERPRHRVFLNEYDLANRPVTNEEFLAFMSDGGYERPEFWLSDGWDAVRTNGWNSPLYWEQRGNEWWSFTLAGMRPIEPSAPVCHVSYYEADACARWAGARLPTEAEWEAAGADVPIEGNLVESGHFHPTCVWEGEAPAEPSTALRQMFGDVWEWTASPYIAYPGFRPEGGALGEYNGKFMCNQMVLRGGSCATPQSHIRATYRNFFVPSTRWQFSGFRLARDL